MRLEDKENFLSALIEIESSDLMPAEKAVALLSLQLRVSVSESGLPAMHREQVVQVKKLHDRIALERPLSIYRQRVNHRELFTYRVENIPEIKPEQPKRNLIGYVKEFLKI